MSILKTVLGEFKSAATTVKEYFTCHINLLKIAFLFMTFNVHIQLHIFDRRRCIADTKFHQNEAKPRYIHMKY